MYRTGELAAVQDFSVIKLLYSCDKAIEMEGIDRTVFLRLVVENGMEKLAAFCGKVSIAHYCEAGVADIADQSSVCSGIQASLHRTVDSHITTKIFPAVINDSFSNGSKGVAKFSVAFFQELRGYIFKQQRLFIPKAN